MMAISYVWGQKYYYIPYAWKKLTAYLVIVVLLFFLHNFITHFFTGKMTNLLTATILLFLFIWFVSRIERKEFAQLPVVGKYFRR